MKITYRTLLTMVNANEQPKKIKVGTATYTWNGCDYILNTDSRRSLSDTLTSWTTKAQTTAEFIEVVEELLTIECAPTVEAEPKWIPLSKKLPNKNDYVIVTTKCGVVIEAQLEVWNSGEKEWWIDNDNIFPFDDVVAWMPLPEPYEVKHETY